MELNEQSIDDALIDEIETVARRAADLAGQVLAYAGRGDDSDTIALDFNDLIRETATCSTP